MNVLLINGSPNARGCTYTALSEAAGALEKNGVGTEIFHIGTEPVQGCTGCEACGKTGRCILGGAEYTALAERAEKADGLIVGSPVYFAGPNGALLALMDRLFYSMRGNFRHKPAAAVVSCRRGGASASFDRLNKYFTICEMFVVSSQYWNSVHGNTPEEVRHDLEGLQTMRTLGNNMAFLLKVLDAAKAAHIEVPAREVRVVTNFIEL